MKFRSDFVTNSSSSSFILAFNNEKEYSDFEQRCDDSNYKPVIKLMRRCRKHQQQSMDEIKAEAIAQLRHWLTWDISREYCKARIDQSLSFPDQLKCESAIKESDEYQQYIDDYLKEKTDFEEYVNRINAAEFIISDTIWDSSGGLLEYAIRNGLLRTFYPYFVYQEDIG